METNGEGTYFQEGDHVRIKRTQEIGRVHAADGGVIYVLMDETDETKMQGKTHLFIIKRPKK